MEPNLQTSQSTQREPGKEATAAIGENCQSWEDFGFSSITEAPALTASRITSAAKRAKPMWTRSLAKAFSRFLTPRRAIDQMEHGTARWMNHRSPERTQFRTTS